MSWPGSHWRIYSHLAWKYTGDSAHPLKVCRSAAGWYIGAWDPLEGPISRDSVEYYRTEVAALAALHVRSWTQRTDA